MLPESHHSNTDALDISQIRIYDPSKEIEVTVLYIYIMKSCLPEKIKSSRFLRKNPPKLLTRRETSFLDLEVKYHNKE